MNNNNPFYDIIQLLSVSYLPVGRFGMLRTKENLKLLALKVVAVAYERKSLTRGFKYSNLTQENFRYFGKLAYGGPSTP